MYSLLLESFIAGEDTTNITESTPVVSATPGNADRWLITQLIADDTPLFNKEKLMNEFLQMRREERGLPPRNKAKSQKERPIVGEVYETPFQWLMPRFPYPSSMNMFDEALEYTYEIFRGTRLATQSELDVCEIAFSNFFESWYAAGEEL